MTSPATVALCGLGNMGGAIAGRIAASRPLIGFDLSADRRAEAEQAGAQVTDNLEELATAPVILLSLPSPAISLAVVTQLLPLVQEGTLLIETSTVNPEDMRRLHELCGSRMRVVDAALLSGVAQMVAGQAAVLVGGADSDVADARPVLDLIGAEVTHLGEIGSAMAAKVIHNAVIHAVMVVLAEAGALAVKNGVSGTELARILADPERGLLRPLTHRYAERILSGNYDGGMPTEAARKDSTLVLELAELGRVPLFAMQASHTVYELAVNAGYGRDDYAAIARLWENWLSISLVEGSAE